MNRKPDSNSNTSTGPALVRKLNIHETEILQHIATTGDQWRAFKKRLRAWLDKPKHDFYDEQVWTFLIASGYAAAGREGVAKLTGSLTGRKNVVLADRVAGSVLPAAVSRTEFRTKPLDRSQHGIELSSGVSLLFLEKPDFSDRTQRWTSDFPIFLSSTLSGAYSR